MRLSYVNVICVYLGAGSEFRGFKMFCQRGQKFFYLFCVWGGRGGVKFSISPSVKK